MDFFIICELRDEQIMKCGGPFRKDIKANGVCEGEKVGQKPDIPIMG